MTSGMYRWLLMVAALSLFCSAGASAESDRMSLYILFGADELASNVNAVRETSASLPLAERYEYLKNWVLPSQAHSDIRVIGEFTPTDPAPLTVELESHRFTSDRGGELVSPVFDLLETAKETGKLQELSSAVEQLPDPQASAPFRSKLSLQILLAMELQDANTLDSLVPKLFSMTSATFKHQGANYWPELHLIAWSIDHRSNYRLVGTLLSDLYIQRFQIGMRDLWKCHILTWMGRYEDHLENRRNDVIHTRATPAEWIPLTRANSKSRGEGFPSTSWQIKDRPEVMLHSGHDQDYLMYRSPLAGDYQVEGEMKFTGESQIQLLGRYVGPHGNGKAFKSGTFTNRDLVQDAIIPTVKRGPTIRYRGKVEDSRASVFLNGQLVLSYAASGTADPWLALRCGTTSRGNFFNVQISGDPDIPESVSMSLSPTLSGWIPYYLDLESAGRDYSDWQWVAGEGNAGQIVGRRSQTPPGSSFESLLRYQRPLVEDGTVEYEFFYQPGEYNAHPAFDRLVFLVRPEGVRIHWLTDGKYDSTGVPPDNIIDEPENRRGPANLPLIPNGWNRMTVAAAGDLVTLELNGTLIYERNIEPANARTFGLFHYSDRETLLVRDAVMKAAWPMSLPSLEEQELSDPLLAVVDKDADRLKTEFTHDFTKDGLPEAYFKLIGRNAEQRLIVQSDGLHSTLTPSGQWNNLGIIPHFSLQGDFDIEVEFDQFRLDGVETRGEIVLQAVLEDTQTHWLRSVRGQSEIGEQNFNGAITYQINPEKRQFDGDRRGEAANAGRLRIARRGTDFYGMFAEGDSPVYRIVKHENIPDANVQMHGIEIKQFLKDNGSVSVVWKDVSIRAEKMFYLASGNKRIRKLFTMSPDGRNLRELTAPKFGLSHLGSPEFSTDGTRLVMDMSTGPTTTSHIVIMNRDGSDMKDLGMGCMPSLSADGKSIVFSDPGAGIVKMEADGENRETLERSGWGVQYSPDGKHIAYSSYSNITLMDPETEQKTPLFEGELANRYSRVYWNFGWSPDSRAIAFKGHVRATGQQELAVVDIKRPDKIEVLYAGNGIYEDFTFSPDSQRVLFALRKDGPTQPDLYLAHRRTPGQIERLKGQPDDYPILDCDWSPDGKQIVFAALVEPTPVPWPIEDDSEAGPR